MDAEPTDEDIAEAIKIGSAGPSPSVREVRESVGTGLAWEADMYVLALTIAKLRHAETLIADRDAEIVRLSQPILYQRPEGANMDEWRKNVYPTDLYHRGDTVMVWINEGSICLPPFVRAQPMPKAPQP